MANEKPADPQNKDQLEPLIDKYQTALALGIEPGTLDVWASTKRYPLPFVRIGRLRKYRPADIRQNIAERMEGGEDKPAVTACHTDEGVQHDQSPALASKMSKKTRPRTENPKQSQADIEKGKTP